MDKIGLILEGGGMRGIYTAGVLDFFIDKNIEVDLVVGVSAGGCHAASYLSKQYNRAFRTNIDYLHDKEYLSFRNLIKTVNSFPRGEKNHIHNFAYNFQGFSDHLKVMHESQIKTFPRGNIIQKHNLKGIMVF